ncbi:DUF3262 family protein [Klebsiella variicola]|uniref:DUF3262 family protein n=1 Tax=Klebsiella variicola TaxID=244366 RepID=UPI000D6FDE01|nr:DUF3262 family protein [Klebsiella variicola]MBY5172967.1 DUF3262 family protein [Klebsiella variicola]
MNWLDAFLTASGESDPAATVLLTYGTLFTFLLLITAWVLISAWKEVARSGEKGGMTRLMTGAIRLLVLLLIVLWFFFS